MTSIELQGISKQFGNTHVIRQLNLSIAEGEFLTLVGPSGCGKSTLLRIIAGLEQQTHGHLHLSGTAIDHKRPSERDLAMVFQSYALYPHLSVFDNIAVPLRMRLLNRWQRLPILRHLIPNTAQLNASIHQQVIEVAEALGLSELLHRKPSALSGGQRQRVAVGRAIVRQPKAFLFDEPLSNLDAKLRVHMRTEIIQLHQHLKTTFVYVTHDQVEAMTMSDRIAVMMQGEIVQIGTPDEVYHNPQDIRVAQFIGSPEINLFKARQLACGSTQLFGQILKTHYRATGATSFSQHTAQRQTKEQDIHVGIRPENLFLLHPDVETQKHVLCLEGKVTLVENLGAEIFVHFNLLVTEEQADNQMGTQQTLIMRLAYNSSIQVSLDMEIRVGFLAESLYLFDAHGKRMKACCYTHDDPPPYSEDSSDNTSKQSGAAHG